VQFVSFNSEFSSFSGSTRQIRYLNATVLKIHLRTHFIMGEIISLVMTTTRSKRAKKLTLEDSLKLNKVDLKGLKKKKKATKADLLPYLT